jgi:hypothetical protein
MSEKRSTILIADDFMINRQLLKTFFKSSMKF